MPARSSPVHIPRAPRFPCLPASQNGKPVDIRYGIDEFAHCGVMLDYFEDFNRFIELIERNRTWECRVAFAPEQDFFLPLELPIWGVVEPQHIHVNNHFNFVFHALKGRIVGATVYPGARATVAVAPPPIHPSIHILNAISLYL